MGEIELVNVVKRERKGEGVGGGLGVRAGAGGGLRIGGGGGGGGGGDVKSLVGADDTTPKTVAPRQTDSSVGSRNNPQLVADRSTPKTVTARQPDSGVGSRSNPQVVANQSAFKTLAPTRHSGPQLQRGDVRSEPQPMRAVPKLVAPLTGWWNSTDQSALKRLAPTGDSGPQPERGSVKAQSQPARSAPKPAAPVTHPISSITPRPTSQTPAATLARSDASTTSRPASQKPFSFQEMVRNAQASSYRLAAPDASSTSIRTVGQALPAVPGIVLGSTSTTSSFKDSDMLKHMHVRQAAYRKANAEKVAREEEARKKEEQDRKDRIRAAEEVRKEEEQDRKDRIRAAQETTQQAAAKKKAEEDKLAAQWHERAKAQHGISTANATTPVSVNFQPACPPVVAPIRRLGVEKRPGSSVLGKLGAQARADGERRNRDLKILHERQPAIGSRNAASDDADAQLQADLERELFSEDVPEKADAFDLLKQAEDQRKQKQAKETYLEPSTFTRTRPTAPAQAPKEPFDGRPRLVIPPTGPFALNSAAGIQVARQAAAEQPKRDFVPLTDEPRRSGADTAWFNNAWKKGKTRKISQFRGDSRNLGEVTLHDLQMIKWRESGMTFDDVVPLYAEHTGLRRSTTYLSDRFKLVMQAIAPEEITSDMLEQVLAGDDAARAAMNQAINAHLTGDFKPLTISEIKARPPKFNVAWQRNTQSLEVTADDLRLVKWREQGAEWDEIVTKFREHTGISRGQDTLRKRFRYTEAAIESDDIPLKLCEEVIQGKPGASQELNRLVNQHRQMKAQQESAITPKAMLSLRKGKADVPRSSNGLSSPPWSEGSQRYELHTPRQRDENRPEHGGKVMSEEVFQYYLQATQDAWQHDSDDEDEDDDNGREGSPLCDEDYCYNVFQVESRSTLQRRRDGEDDQDDDIDQIPWIPRGEPFEELMEANEYAAKHVTRTKKGCKAIASGEAEFTLHNKYTDEGYIAMRLSSAVGTMQMRVTKHLRSFQEGIMPQSKATWISKTVFVVQIRRASLKSAEEGEDAELFGLVESEVSQSIANGQMYTELRRANTEAIKAWLGLTWRCSTTKIDQRALEFNAMVDEHEEALRRVGDDGEEGEPEKFCFEREDGSARVKVWVEALKTTGPRNL